MGKLTASVHVGPLYEVMTQPLEVSLTLHMTIQFKPLISSLVLLSMADRGDNIDTSDLSISTCTHYQ